MTRRRSWWGWGFEDQALPRDQRQSLADAVFDRFGLPSPSVREPVDLDDVVLAAPRVSPPSALAAICTTDRYERAAHTYGKAYRDVVRAFRGTFEHPPDVVAFPSGEGDIAALLDWCTSSRLAAVPYGGGSSVVGGVSCEVGDGYRGAVSIDLRRLGRLLEVDRTSRAGRIQAGVTGPSLEDQLRPHGLTLRHFPQSFEHSTLGGWLATRSGGHYATGPTHIDDFVESVRMLSPQGIVETRRLPASGAGPSPDRLVLGSEGTLGVISEAWLRLQDRPRFRGSAAVRFERYADGVAATREVVQSGLRPANCRLLDRDEAAISAGAGGRHHVLLLGFESAHLPVDEPLAQALDICRAHAGEVPDPPRLHAGGDGARGDGTRGGAVGAWRRAFLGAPYVRDALVSASVVVETFETACTWQEFPALHASVTGAVRGALMEICGTGTVTCRFTHVYPDGPAPYFSVLAPGRSGSEVSQWDEIKAAASEAVLASGGTITHHHAVGRVHRNWYDRQRPGLFARALQAAKSVLDPAGVLNPGVLVDPL